MKTKLISILLFTFMVNLCTCQENEAFKKFTFGFHTGINLNYFNSRVSELANNKSLGYEDYFRVSGQLGLDVNYNINDYITLGTGVRYIGKGMEYRKKEESIINTFDQEDNYLRVLFRLDYIEIPLHINFNFNKIFNPKYYNGKPVYVSLGLITGFNMNSDLKANSYTPTNESSYSYFVDVKEEFQTYEFDYAEPILFSYAISSRFIINEYKNYRLWLGLEFNQSLNEVYNSSSIVSDDNYKSKMGSFQLKIMIDFI